MIFSVHPNHPNRGCNTHRGARPGEFVSSFCWGTKTNKNCVRKVNRNAMLAAVFSRQGCPWQGLLARCTVTKLISSFWDKLCVIEAQSYKLFLGSAFLDSQICRMSIGRLDKMKRGMGLMKAGWTVFIKVRSGPDLNFVSLSIRPIFALSRMGANLSRSQITGTCLTGGLSVCCQAVEWDRGMKWGPQRKRKLLLMGKSKWLQAEILHWVFPNPSELARFLLAKWAATEGGCIPTIIEPLKWFWVLYLGIKSNIDDKIGLGSML